MTDLVSYTSQTFQIDFEANHEFQIIIVASGRIDNIF